MPRACKRTRQQSQAENKAVRTSERSGAELFQEQDSRRYAEPVPDVTIHYTNTGSIPSPMENPPISYGRAAKRQRMDVGELSHNMQQNHSRARYPTVVASRQELSVAYTRTTRNVGPRNPNISQVLYPNIMQAPRSTTPYSVPDQYSGVKQIQQAATAPEQQATGYRYNLRRSVHSLNLPISTAPNMTNRWTSTNNSNLGTSSISPETQNLPGTIQKQQQPTQKQNMGPKLKHVESQTELTLTDDEISLIKTVREKGMDPKQLKLITENNQLVVTNNDDSRVETVNTLMKASQELKISLLAQFCTMSYANKIGALMPTTHPALTYPGADNGNTSYNDENASPSGQQMSQEQLHNILNTAAIQPANATNNDITPQSDEAAPPPQPQVSQQIATGQGNPSLPIPTLVDQWNYYKRFQQCRYPARPQMRQNFNTPYHFFQNLQNNNHMAYNSNFYPNMQSLEQFGMSGW